MSRSARFAWGVLGWNVAVILWGGFVRATGSGAGCGGHWPTCNGDVLPRAPSVATLIELSHRVTSGAAFFAVMALGVVTFLGTRKGHPARLAVVLAMLFMLGEVLIGAAIVVLGHVALDPSLLHGVFTELHAGNTFLLLTALTLTAHHLDGGPPLRLAGRGSVVASLAQAFGALAFTLGSGAIAALGDTLFPARSLAEGFAEDLSPGSHVFLHIRTLHPVFAVIAFVLVLGACLSIRAEERMPERARRYAGWALAVLCFQMGLGLLNLWLLVPIPTQILHLATADALFVLLVLTAAHALAQRDEHPESVAGGTSLGSRTTAAV
jgi:protoheme IX farnesyltransferase